MRVAIRDHQLVGIVHQVGAVSYHNLGPYYRSADVFISPSRADTWGVAVLEAMASENRCCVPSTSELGKWSRTERTASSSTLSIRRNLQATWPSSFKIKVLLGD